jgi:hypothetical protein
VRSCSGSGTFSAKLVGNENGTTPSFGNGVDFAALLSLYLEISSPKMVLKRAIVRKTHVVNQKCSIQNSELVAGYMELANLLDSVEAVDHKALEHF